MRRKNLLSRVVTDNRVGGGSGAREAEARRRDGGANLGFGAVAWAWFMLRWWGVSGACWLLGAGPCWRDVRRWRCVAGSISCNVLLGFLQKARGTTASPGWAGCSGWRGGASPGEGPRRA